MNVPPFPHLFLLVAATACQSGAPREIITPPPQSLAPAAASDLAPVKPDDEEVLNEVLAEICWDAGSFVVSNRTVGPDAMSEPHQTLGLLEDTDLSAADREQLAQQMEQRNRQSAALTFTPPIGVRFASFDAIQAEVKLPNEHE